VRGNGEKSHLGRAGVSLFGVAAQAVPIGSIGYYEIAPKVPMTLEKFQELLKQVVLKE
jgi:hypothetical protein